MMLLVFGIQAESAKALYVTGGCCHDYAAQQVIIPEGLGKRISLKTEILHEAKAEGLKKKLQNPKWHEGFDIIIYNFCQAHEKDAAFIDSVAKVHHDGKPAIALHCTMHSYHWRVKGEKKSWTEMLGVTSPNHGPKSPIAVEVKEKKHPIMKNIPEKWTTPEGELYNMSKVHDTAKVLMEGKRTKKGGKKSTAIAWVNTYGKGHVFATSLGHHNSTVKTKEYLDMLSNAVVWLLKKK